MTRVKWMDDEAGLAVLLNLGIEWEDKTIPVSAINVTLSMQNRARKNPLDETRVDVIRSAWKQGIPLPKIIVRKILAAQYVIVGGNHRFNSLVEETHIPVHVVECTDVEFETVCKVLNTVVGEGMTKQERIDAAVDAVERLGLSNENAARLYGVAKETIRGAVSHKETLALASGLPKKQLEGWTQSHARILGQELSNNPNIVRAAIQCVSANKMSVSEFSEVLKEAKSQPTEASKIAVLERFTQTAEKTQRRAIPRKIRSKFFQACNHIISLEGSKTWESIEITTQEKKLATELAQKTVCILTCLLKANG